MPNRFQRCCRQPGCTVLTRDASGFCTAHVAHAGDVDRLRSRMRRENDPIWSALYGWRWQQFKEYMRVQGYVGCQRRGCMQIAEIYHHLWSPRVHPELMYVPSNVVGVCRAHHPSTESDPDAGNMEALAKKYELTVLSLPSDYGHEGEIKCC